MGLSHFSKKEMNTMRAIPCKDHLGNEFPNKTAMCKHYGISSTVFDYRKNEKHMSLKDALTMPLEQTKNSCKDHLGNEFPNKKAMCDHYGINTGTFDRRMTEKQMSLEEALTTPVRKKHNGSCKDHLGNEFPNKKTMCDHYGISRPVFDKRRNEKHMSLKDALTMPVKQIKNPCKDHLGNEFPSMKAMCEHYDISENAFRDRRNKKQMSLEKILTTPAKKKHNGLCKDHLGNEFPNQKAMLDYYGINMNTFYRRRNEKHMSLKETLTMPVEKQHKGSCKDHLGNEFPNKKAMCKHYGISESAFSNRTKNNASIEEALGIIPYICFKTKNTRITNNLFIKEVKAIHNKMLYAVCIYNDIDHSR